MSAEPIPVLWFDSKGCGPDEFALQLNPRPELRDGDEIICKPTLGLMIRHREPGEHLMPKFKSIPHEVTAVQWQGEITPELRALFGPRPIEVNTDPLGLFRPTLTVPQEGEHLAVVGDWVVRTDYDEELGFDLDVIEPDDFSETYETADAGKPPFDLEFLEFAIAVPLTLMSANGEHETDLRVKLSTRAPRPEVVATAVAQLLPHLKNPTMAVGCMQALCADLDPDTLITVRDMVERIMIAKSTHH